MMLALLMLLAQEPTQQPAPPDSTQGRPCVVDVDYVGREGRQVEAGGAQNLFAGGGVRAHCRGTNTTLASDSLAWYGGENRLDLVGNVRIRDTALTLDANLASYFRLEERLEAHNRVVAVNRGNGSVLRGPNLNYYRAIAGVRDTTEMVATQRPTIEYHAGGAADTSEPYVIVADRVRFRGNDRMWAGGNATIDRSDFAARGDSMMLDQSTGFGVLVGKPHVEGKGPQAFTLRGTRIELGLERREMRRVKALGEGESTGSDWKLTADTIDLRLERRKLQQAFAWGKDRRPYAVSTLQTIRADSIALDVPDQVLTEARAYGRALSTTRKDSTSGPETTDWITGDTLRARWEQQTDSGRTRSRLRTVFSHGSARALTHLYDAKNAPPAVNYSRGQSILIALQQGKIDRVTVGGRADGVHLEPVPPPAVDSAADSTRRAPADTTVRRDST